MRRRQLLQWFGSSLRIDGGAVVQIAGDEDCVRLFAEDFGNHPAQETAVTNMPQMQVADEGGPASPPGIGQVRQSYRRSCDPRPAGIEHAVSSSYQRDPEQNLHHPVEVHREPEQPPGSENNPRRDCSDQQKAQQPSPDRRKPVKATHCSIGVTKREQRGGDKAHRQKARAQRESERRSDIGAVKRKRPRLQQEEVRQKQNGLKDQDENKELSAGSMTIRHTNSCY